MVAVENVIENAVRHNGARSPNWPSHSDGSPPRGPTGPQRGRGAWGEVESLIVVWLGRGTGEGSGHRGAHGRCSCQGPTRENATMAEDRSLTTRDAVEGVLASEHADVLRESVAVMVRKIMELEVSQLANAGLDERAPGRHSAQRNGYRDRRWDARVGEIELPLSRLRTGSYLPSFLEPRRRAEQALVAVVLEAYVNGRRRQQDDCPGRPYGATGAEIAAGSL